MKLIAAALGATVLAAGSAKATLSAPTHTPKINTKWFYVVRVTQGGVAASARITVQIVDPLGSAHAVQLGASRKNITDYPIKGRFRDYVIWPADSRGVPLTLRVTVRASGTKTILKYRVVSH